jgi:hypothetical protein
MTWRLVWDGNDSKAERHARALHSEEYQNICQVLHVGCRDIQRDLFVEMRG